MPQDLRDDGWFMTQPSNSEGCTHDCPYMYACTPYARQPHLVLTLLGPPAQWKHGATQWAAGVKMCVTARYTPFWQQWEIAYGSGGNIAWGALPNCIGQ